MNFEVVKWLLIAYMISIAILMATYYFKHLKKTTDKTFWKNMGWWSLASVIVACCTGSGMSSPSTSANIICCLISLLFIIANAVYIGLEKN